jgi:uncharacterized cupin superfamily protein
MFRTPAITLTLATLACGASGPLDTAVTTHALTAPGLVIYPRGVAVPDCDLVDLGSPEGLGATAVSGHPRLSARIDYVDGTLTAGVLQATRGVLRLHFPATEHATILVGSVTLTDPSGQRAVLHPGDSYLINQGTDILWEVSGPRVQRSFLSRVEDTDGPSGMRIYRRGVETPAAELITLGPPETLGAITIAGSPTVSARFDLVQGPTSAGVIDSTPGTVRFDFPFTGHSTVTYGRLGLTGPDGRTHLLRPGDGYLVVQGTTAFWDMDRAHLQQSFFHPVVAAP